MNKQTIAIVLALVAILALVGIFSKKKSPQQPANNNTAIQQNNSGSDQEVEGSEADQIFPNK